MSGFRSISGSARQWGEALDLMDRSGRLTRRETNALVDQVALQLDAEHELAALALRRRLIEQARAPRPPLKGARRGA
jgi:hypothetical protein